jgi:hypothetical protein
VIFFLSEKRKFTLENADSSLEGSYDTYKLTVNKFQLKRTGGPNREKIHTATWNVRIERVLLAVGADRRGEVMVKVTSTHANQGKAYFKKGTYPINLKTEFLPEGLCNFTFFDSDLVNFKGDQVRKDERWKFIRPLSLYGEKELNTEIHYTFIGKDKREETQFGRIDFETPSKRWIENGLNSVDKISGSLWVHEDTGKLEKLEYTYTKHNDQRKGYYFTGLLERVNSAVISNKKLRDIREEFESSEKKVRILHRPKKRIKPATAKGPKGDLKKKFDFNFDRPKSDRQYTLQLRAYPQNEKGKEIAGILRDRLKQKGHDGFIIKENGMYKVCAGKYQKDSQILQERLTLLQPSVPDAFIREIP